DGDGDNGCGAVPFDLEYLPPNVMWVVDTSGSMGLLWDHDLNPNTPAQTRWKVLHGAISTVMQQFGPATNAGIQRFPSEAACDPNPCYNSTGCLVSESPDVGVALNNGAAMLAAMPGADDDGTSIEGGGPITSAINSAVTYLSSLAPEVPRHIVLITDGAANCTPGFAIPELLESYDETLVPTVEAALDDNGIETYVVGIEIVDAVLGAGTDGV